MESEVKRVAKMTVAMMMQSLFSVLLSAPVLAKAFSTDQVNAPTPAAQVEWQQLSTATATWMWLDIYDASLYATSQALSNLSTLATRPIFSET